MTTQSSSYLPSPTPSASGLTIAIITTEWHRDVVLAMEQEATNTLTLAGLPESSIRRYVVPGAFELPFVAAQLCNKSMYDAVIALGCIVRGETPHFDFVAAPVAHALQMIQVESGVPVIFGVLTTETLEQAIARSNGQHGNKGQDCAVAAIQMALLKKSFTE